MVFGGGGRWEVWCFAATIDGQLRAVSSSAVSSEVRVLVVDDSPVFRDAVRSLIEATPGFEWIGDASSGEDGIGLAARLEPDLVLMDLRMPGIGGVEAARGIADLVAATVILITGAEPVPGAPVGPAAELIAKERLSPASLTRLWREHGNRPSEARQAG
jgi:hypothetical protein